MIQIRPSHPFYIAGALGLGGASSIAFLLGYWLAMR